MHSGNQMDVYTVFSHARGSEHSVYRTNFKQHLAEELLAPETNERAACSFMVLESPSAKQ